MLPRPYPKKLNMSTNGLHATTCNSTMPNPKKLSYSIRRPRVNTRVVEPQSIPGLLRVDQMKILGVTFSNTMTFKAHVNSLVCQSSQSMYALRVLRSHGLFVNPLWEVTRATLVARLLYASPTWWGFLDAGGKRRLQATLPQITTVWAPAQGLSYFWWALLTKRSDPFSSCPQQWKPCFVPSPPPNKKQ